MMLSQGPNYVFADSLVDELSLAGLRHVCICPGSRSTPAAIAFARDSRIKKWFHLDERSASFFALGMAKTLDKPVALLSTSGTAAANFYPAVIEAKQSGVPLIIITADRPAELWEWGAPQTTDQTRLYSNHAKWAVNLPTPELGDKMVTYIRSLASRIYATAVEGKPGPVHVNMPFRDPLTPQSSASYSEEFTQELNVNEKVSATHSRVLVGKMGPDTEDIKNIAGTITSNDRGIIVCGPTLKPDLAPLIAALAKRTGYPVIADPLSNLRAGPHDLEQIVDNYDLFMRDPALIEDLVPEIIVRFGSWPTNRPLMNFLESARISKHIYIGDGEWSDPLHLNSITVRADPALTLEKLCGNLSSNRPNSYFLDKWLSLRNFTSQAISQHLRVMDELFEGKIFNELSKFIPDGTTLFAGNSMPVRDMDTYFPLISKSIHFQSNRGVNGIDGVVSTALGSSAANGDKLILVIGDVSFYHDMNGLLATLRYGIDATIIVINNDGGAIFSFLPQYDHKEHFEDLFGTPHGLNFQFAADFYGLPYTKITSWKEFQTAVSHSLSSKGTSIIEIPSGRETNLLLHNKLSRAILATVKDAFDSPL